MRMKYQQRQQTNMTNYLNAIDFQFDWESRCLWINARTHCGACRLFNQKSLHGRSYCEYEMNILITHGCINWVIDCEFPSSCNWSSIRWCVRLFGRYLDSFVVLSVSHVCYRTARAIVITKKKLTTGNRRKRTHPQNTTQAQRRSFLQNTLFDCSQWHCRCLKCKHPNGSINLSIWKRDEWNWIQWLQSVLSALGSKSVFKLTSVGTVDWYKCDRLLHGEMVD